MIYHRKDKPKENEHKVTTTDLIEKSQEISGSWLEKGLPKKPEDNGSDHENFQDKQ